MVAMTSWDEVVAYVVGRYPIHERRDTFISFGWPARKPVGLVEAQFAEVGGLGRVFLGSRILRQEETSAKAALELNGDLLIGSFVFFNGLLFLRDTLILGRFDEAKLEETVGALARARKELGPRVRKQETPGPPGGGRAFAE